MKPKLSPSVCIDAVFSGLSFDEACYAVSQTDISSIEFWSWWDKDLSALQAAVNRYDLNICCCCTKFISLVDDKQREAYLQGLKESIKVAKELNINIIISQVGDFIEGKSREQQKQSIIDGLLLAKPLLEASEVTLVVEPLNELIDHKGYFLVSSEEAFDVIKQVNSPNVKVLFDIYHQQISEGNILNNIRANIQYIGHFHAAGNPGRNELQRGEINYPQIIEGIKTLNYKGHIGLEYWPASESENTLAPLKEVSCWFK